MKEKISAKFAEAYARPPESVAQAPGRIEFIGNHTDYNGGCVMGAAIDRFVCCALAKRGDRKLCFANPRDGAKVCVDMDDISPRPRELNWVNYPLGVFKFLLEAGMKADCGFDMLDMSTLPSGSGLSSSAAIELSSAFAMKALYGFELGLKETVRLARRCENEFVGMPCGILDQGVSGFGKKDALVFIDCLTEEFSTCPLPSGTAFRIFNSTKKHALVDGLYAERHRECMEAARILSGDGEFKLLRHFTTADLEAAKDKMTDAQFRRAKHIIEENSRVLEAKAALENGDIARVGRLMTASHNSSRALFENSCEELDFLVDALSKSDGVYGARLMGGGFGGAAIALVNADFSDAQAEAVSRAYEGRFGKRPSVFSCKTADGAKVL